jgi:hypothetical protein
MRARHGDRGHELNGVDRLGDVHLIAGDEGLSAILRARVGRERGGRGPCSLLGGEEADSSDEGIAILAGHADVGDHHVGAILRERVERVGDALRRDRDRAVLREHARDSLARVLLVVDDEHAQTLELLAVFEVGLPARRRARERPFPDRSEREGQNEGRAAALAFAVRDDVASMKLDEVTADGEAEAEAALRAVVARLCLLEAVEHLRQEAGVDPSTVVVDAELDVRGTAPQRHLDAAPFVRELRRVDEEIPDHLL